MAGPKNYILRFHWQILLMLCLCSRAFAADIYILSSSDIIPYNTCIDGIKDALPEFSINVLDMEEDLDKGRQMLADIQQKNPKLVIAVGPRAAYLLKDVKTPKIFCMVLNPMKILGQNSIYTGISLNIPEAFQIEAISKAFPGEKTVGVFYSSKSNMQTLSALEKEAGSRHIAINPLKISSTSDIPKTINSKSFSIDILLIIPDSMLKSKKIVEYIIKESLMRKIPVVGYNSWFSKNGAIISFVIDYREVGRQTALTGKTIISGTEKSQPEIMPPEKIKIFIDLKIAEKIGVLISPNIIKMADKVVE